MTLSVIICTHNPRKDHLVRTLDALHAQTLPTAEWELVVVDNASAPSIEQRELPAGPATMRVVRESALGIVAARLRGIAEARGELLVFVDDDNILAPDYLEQAEARARRCPTLGAFGGQIHGEFEVPPKPWFAARLERLAIREFTRSAHTSEPDVTLAPCGAGLCVQATVAQRYRERALVDPKRHAFGHSGTSPGAGDDTDLALTACDLGLEIGRFPELQLTHLIPAERLTLGYFARATRGQAKAHLRLLVLRGQTVTRWRQTLAACYALSKWTVIDVLLSLRSRQRGVNRRSSSRQ